MNNDKLNQIFRAARRDAPVEAKPGFENLVITAIRQVPVERDGESVSLFDQLAGWFPKLACAMALLIVLCVAVDFGLATQAHANLTDSLTELSEQWLFAAN